MQSAPALCEKCRLIRFEALGLHIGLQRLDGWSEITLDWAHVVSSSGTCTLCLQHCNIVRDKLHDSTYEVDVQGGYIAISMDLQRRLCLTSATLNITYSCIRSYFKLRCQKQAMGEGHEVSFTVYFHRSEEVPKTVDQLFDPAQASADSVLVKHAIKQINWCTKYNDEYRAKPEVQWQLMPRHCLQLIRAYIPSRRKTSTGMASTFTTSLDRKFAKRRVLVPLFRRVEALLRPNPAHQPWTDDFTFSLSRFRPALIDKRIFQVWTKKCSNEHQHRKGSGNIGFGKSFPSLRLIDVCEKRIVERKLPVRWVALSYTWGETHTCLATTDNIDQLKVTGALDTLAIPHNILDAMIVTADTDERYLWVDSLCIIQDDDNDKQKWIPRMSGIYSQAVYTIVAAGGLGSDAGLPGLRPNTRSDMQQLVRIGNVCITRSLQHNKIESDPPKAHDPANWNRNWQDRAWTLQEYLLSPCKLIFSDEKVSWQCSSATWCEETQRDLYSEIVLREPDEMKCHRMWLTNSMDHVMSYFETLIDEYSQRYLTYESDRLNAVDGILRAFKDIHSLSTIWGLPCAYFGHALTWTSAAETKSSFRSGTCVVTLPDGTVTQCPLPSWSWLAWTGPSNNPGTVVKVYMAALRLVFHTVDQRRSRTVTMDGPQGLNGQPDSRSVRIPEWYDEARVKISATDFPECVDHENLWPIVLGVWTSVAAIDLEFNTRQALWTSDDPASHRLRRPDTSEYVPFYYMQLQDENFEPGTVERVNLILVRYTEDVKGSDLAYAIVAAQYPDTRGLYKRRGLVQFWRTWASLTQSWKRVFLI